MLPDQFERQSFGLTVFRVFERVLNVPDSVDDAVTVDMTVAEDVRDRPEPSNLFVKRYAASHQRKTFKTEPRGRGEQVPAWQEVRK
jgi:hypothetical protein